MDSNTESLNNLRKLKVYACLQRALWKAFRGELNAEPPAVCKYLHFLTGIHRPNAYSGVELTHMPTHSQVTNCAVCCLPWPRSSHATPNPVLCCSLLVACKDSVSAMLKELFTVLHGITVAPRYICCAQTLM